MGTSRCKQVRGASGASLHIFLFFSSFISFVLFFIQLQTTTSAPQRHERTRAYPTAQTRDHAHVRMHRTRLQCERTSTRACDRADGYKQVQGCGEMYPPPPFLLSKEFL